VCVRPQVDPVTAAEFLPACGPMSWPRIARPWPRASRSCFVALSWNCYK